MRMITILVIGVNLMSYCPSSQPWQPTVPRPRLAFQHLSYAATIPIALLLAGLALVPVLDDLRAIVRAPPR